MSDSPVLKRVPLAAIRENPSALRMVNRQHVDYSGLVDSIRNIGVINAIVLRAIPSDGGEQLYGLVDGLHRYTASVDAGLQDIPAQIMSLTDAEAMQAQMIGNMHRIETTPVQYSKQLEKLLAMNPLLTLAQVAGQLNRSESWLKERLHLTSLNEVLHGLVDGGKINLSNAYMLAKLPPEEQLNFTDRAQTMSQQEFTPTVLARKREIDQAKRAGRDPKPDVFVPVPNLQRLANIKEEYAKPFEVKAAIDEDETIKHKGVAYEGAKVALAWVLHLDPKNVGLAKEKDDLRKKVQEDVKAKNKAERDRIKAENAAKVVAALA